MVLSLKTKKLKTLSQNEKLGTKQTKLIGGGYLTIDAGQYVDCAANDRGPNTDTVTQSKNASL
ncbi:hypothetical protein [Pseudoalteromonas umbrosa]|uniref:hypothetical protein n=1 Tax=Pseudoalteromonas umbrosa TaxID=3048489 RepID=UPI0024C3348D|nr:hypothetical protein [Pseudoalteromonas sp. B95]MDK1290307.1 hypothetical protein [Pseudoalteromonas sp. B95]